MTAAYTYGVFTGPEGVFVIEEAKQKDVPWEVFKYALFTITIGAVALLYQQFATHLEKQRETRLRNAEETTRFRNEVIEIFTGLKGFRRKLRFHCRIKPGEGMWVDRTRFEAIYEEFIDLQHRVEALDWRLDLPLDFLGEDQKQVRDAVGALERYTNALVHEADFIDRHTQGDLVFFDRDRHFYAFSLKSTDGNVVKSKFFDPMKRTRRLLRERANSLSADPISVNDS
ncbi:MAG: hypothetical protein AAGE80_19500 [Pseudomonadota bacterium]